MTAQETLQVRVVKKQTEAEGIASFELIQKKECLKGIENIISHHQKFAKKLQPLQLKNYIKNVRQTGTIIAFEICTNDKDDYLNNVSKEFTPFCMKHGVYLRSMGNTIYVMPPYCISSRELKKVYDVVISFIKRITH